MKKAILAVSVVVFLAIVMTFSSCATPLGEQLLMLYEEAEESPSSQEVPWDQTAGEWWDQIGRQVTLTFSPGGDPLPVWGTDVYTSDSSIGTAAVHAGLITFSSGGTITIEIVPGDESYLGTERNGVSTVSYGPWDSGFVFIDNSGNRIYTATGQAYDPVQADDPGEAAESESESEEPAVQEGPAEDITWGFTVSGMETEPGQVMSFRLPLDGSAYTIWGTDVYTDDSCIGTAAVHAGLITFSSGGRVTIEIVPGDESYLGTERNGVVSTPYGPWGKGFVFIDNLGNRIYTATGQANALVEADDPGEAAEFEEPAVQEGPAEDITWGFTVSGMETEPGQVMSFRLPPDGSAYTIWGTDVYTDDSCIGTAAVHAGLITFSSGGRVTIQIREGAESYSGTFRNGVTSTDYGAWGGSFVFIDD